MGMRVSNARITDDHARLLRIGGYDEDGSALTRREFLGLLLRTQREDERLARRPQINQASVAGCVGCALRPVHSLKMAI
jgi:hypothetical protein